MITFLKSLFNKKHMNKYVQEEIEVKEIISHKRNGNVLYVGDKVLVRSNEPDAIWTGIITKWENWGKPDQEPFPIIRDYFTNKEFLCMGIIIPYSDKMLEKLVTMPPIEQWNYLNFLHKKPDYCQIENKYGITYKTYKNGIIY